MTISKRLAELESGLADCKQELQRLRQRNKEQDELLGELCRAVFGDAPCAENRDNERRHQC